MREESLPTISANPDKVYREAFDEGWLEGQAEGFNSGFSAGCTIAEIEKGLSDQTGLLVQMLESLIRDFKDDPVGNKQAIEALILSWENVFEYQS